MYSEELQVLHGKSEIKETKASSLQVIKKKIFCNITDGRSREGVTRLARAGRMTCKVRRDFEIITDVSSRVSQVTSNVLGSSIRSPKSLHKKTGNEILAELKAVVKTCALKVAEAPTRPTPVC